SFSFLLPTMEPVPNRQRILDLLRENGQTISDDVDFSYSRVGEGGGFVSMLYKVRIDDAKFIVKITNPVANLDGFEDTGSIFAKIHNREVNFYRWTATLSEDDRSHMRLAKFYGGCHCAGATEGIIIIEDLSDRMISEHSWKSGYSVDLMKEIIRTIAVSQAVHLHAESKFPTMDDRGTFSYLPSSMRTCIDGQPEKPWLTDANRKRLHIYAENVERLIEDYPDYAKAAPRTIVHRDIWPDNMLFERKEGGGVGLLALIDWQCVCVGNALFDVASLLSVCLTAEVRRSKEKELVDFYWTETQKECSERGTTFEMDLETAHRLYRHCLQWGALLIISMIYFLKLEAEGEGKEGPLSGRLRAILIDLNAE
ncbi:hypothetical protein PMAYCL1PPCAC_26184, partial [Pristionchus mayeri]